MFPYGGYTGALLRVNLSSREIQIDSYDHSFAEKYLGGNGYGARILYDEVIPKTDAFHPQNPLILMTGPCAGTSIPGASRGVVIGKSPLTDGYMESNFGGHFAAELKYAGYDGIIITGQSEKPCYIFIQDDTVEVRDASHLWGLNTYDTQLRLRKELNDSNFATACIGRAGERLVRIACMILGVRAAGRGGLGAVMGSKNLKAIAVRGSRGVKAAYMLELKSYAKELVARIVSNPGTGQVLPVYGTPSVILVNNKLGMLGTNNWQSEVFDNAEGISGELMKEQFTVGNDACIACPIRCGKHTVVKSGPYAGASTLGPEYETLWALGSNCGNGCLASIIQGDRLCDEYGIDTISAGAVIGFAMECYEKGIITEKDTGGLPLNFGNHEAVVAMIQKIGERSSGLGELLGQGVKRAAEVLGHDTWKFAVHAKGLEIPAHSARGVPGMAAGYATSTRGGTHQDGRPTAERVGAVDINEIVGKGRYEVNVQRMTTICDSLILCRMTEGIYGLTGITDEHVKIVKLITGMDLKVKDLVEIADRIWILERAFNIREKGECRDSDTLPYRFMNEPIPTGVSQGKVVTREMLDIYLDEAYEERGWDKETGYPTRETLFKLGLGELVEDIWK